MVIRQGVELFRYSAAPDTAGKYQPPVNPSQVQAQATYKLEIQVGDTILGASTTTPPEVYLDAAVLLDTRTQAEQGRLRLFDEAGAAAYTAPENQLHYLEGLLELRFAPVRAASYQLRTNPATNPGFGGGLAGDNFERPLFHVEGGIGLFGSASVDSVGFNVLPRR